MSNEELLKQAKIQGFAKATAKRKYLAVGFPVMKQRFIQEVAETVFGKMVDENISYDNDVKKCEYIKEILDVVLKDISQLEKEEVFHLIFDTLNYIIEYVLIYYDESK